MGYELRDELLALMHAQARRAVPSLVAQSDLTPLTRSERKLEVVLGRLWGVVGSDALGCLLCLHVAVPNEAQMLAAMHLARALSVNVWRDAHHRGINEP